MVQELANIWCTLDIEHKAIYKFLNKEKHMVLQAMIEIRDKIQIQRLAHADESMKTENASVSFSRSLALIECISLFYQFLRLENKSLISCFSTMCCETVGETA